MSILLGKLEGGDMSECSLSTWSSSSDGESMSSAKLNSSDRMGISAREGEFLEGEGILPKYIINYKKISTGHVRGQRSCTIKKISLVIWVHEILIT